MRCCCMYIYYVSTSIARFIALSSDHPSFSMLHACTLPGDEGYVCTLGAYDTCVSMAAAQVKTADNYV